LSKLFEKLPTEGSFSGGGSCADYVKSGTEELFLVEIIETRKPVGVSFHFFDSGVEIIGKKSGKEAFFEGATERVMLLKYC